MAGMIRLKIAKNLARALLMWATLTVLPPDLLNGGGESNNKIGGRFRLFRHFSFLKALGNNYI
jgi:hypothetical protein